MAPLDEEITETTFVAKRRHLPSLWVNIAALILLAWVIVVAREAANYFFVKNEPPAEIEQHIVLEDLESEVPLAESEPVQMPTVETPAPTVVEAPAIVEAPAVVETPAPVVKPAEAAALRPAPVKKTVRKKPVKKVIPEYAQPDPYTSGGAQDLDNPQQRSEYRKGNVIRVPAKTEAAAAPVQPADERDEFIPFESHSPAGNSPSGL